MKLQPEGPGRRLYVFCCWFGKNGIGRVDEQGNRTRRWDQLVQQLQLLRPQLHVRDGPAREIPAGSVQTGDKTSFNWVYRSRKDDRNRRGCRLGCQQCRGPTCGDHCDLAPNQTGGKRRQSIIVFFRPMVLDGYILTLDKTGFLQTLAERGQVGRGRVCAGRCTGKEADHRYRLLRPPSHRPSHQPAKPRNELPPPHSITSSARSRIDWGTARPSALAALRLITKAIRVGCSTGRSAGFTPLKILSTKVAAR